MKYTGEATFSRVYYLSVKMHENKVENGKKRK